MIDNPEWLYVQADRLTEHRGRIISIYRSSVPTRVIDVSKPDAAGMVEITIEWTAPTSAAGGLIRHEAGRRDVVRAGREEEYLVRIADPLPAQTDGSHGP